MNPPYLRLVFTCFAVLLTLPWQALASEYSRDSSNESGKEQRAPRAGDSKTQPDRCSLSDALNLKLELKNSVQFSLDSGSGPCVFLEVSLPMRIEFELTGPSLPPLQGPQLVTSDTAEPVNIANELPNPMSSDGSTYRMVYTVSAGTYFLIFSGSFKNTKTSNAGIKNSYTLRVAGVEDLTTSLALLTGSQEKIPLEDSTRTVTRKIVVERPMLVRFSVMGVPNPGSERPPGISVRLADGRYLNPAESSPRSASFVLSPRVYFVEVGEDARYFPHYPLKKLLGSDNLSFRIDEIVNQELTDSMKALDGWLTDVGLDQILELSEFVDLRDAKRGLPRADKRLGGFALEVVMRRAGVPVWRFSEYRDLATQIASGGDVVWPAGLKPNPLPLLVVSLRSKIDRHEMDANEVDFWKTHQTTLWDRVLQKISALEGVSARRIVLFVDLQCGAPLVFLHTDHHAYRQGQECKSASTSIVLTRAAKVGSSGVLQVESLNRDLGGSVPSFLKSFTAPETANLEFLTTEPDFVEVIVRGLRGHVIRGGRDWERIQLTISITGGTNNRPLTLHVGVDGRLASGLGGYPADSQFTRDMEPQYSANLTDYAKRLANSLREQLLAK